jgi:DNA processing protein
MDRFATPNHIECLDWLSLSRSENIGPITFFQLIRRFGTAAAPLEAVPELDRHGGCKRPIRLLEPSKAEQEADAIANVGAHLLTVLGRTEMLRGQEPTVWIVGARNASGAGRRIAQGIAKDLGGRGIIFASGLALGIDTSAHNGALKTGTIAVVAGGGGCFFIRRETKNCRSPLAPKVL